MNYIKQILIFLFLFSSLISVAQQQDTLHYEKGNFTNKYYIGDKAVSYDIFLEKLASNEKASNMVQSGKNLNIFGAVICCIGAFGVGCDLGERIGGGKGKTGLFLGSAIVMFGGLVIDKLGNIKIKKAISLYNESRKSSASFSISPTGLGLAIVF